MQKDLFIKKTETIKSVLKKLGDSAEKVLLIVDDNGRKLLGTITDGDIRSLILRGGGLSGSIEGIYNEHPLFIHEKDYEPSVIRDIFLNKKVTMLPVVDEDMNVVDLLTWSKFFSEPEARILQEVDMPVIIMAGGKGTRLDPFTKVLPKPLVPIGEKPIAELIIDEFRKYGIDKYFFTLNYKAELIESYFDGMEKDYAVHYIRENDFYGTAGSLILLKDKVNGSFIVSNCDVIVKADYADVAKIHMKNNADLTILSSIKHYKIPYGVVDFGKGGRVREIKEKPEYSFVINTGVYIINSDMLEFIPENAHFDMTDLIRILIKNGKNVITYPVNENDYIDIGEWEEYKRAVNRLGMI